MSGTLTIVSNQISAGAAQSPSSSTIIGPLLISAVNPVLEVIGLTFSSATFITTSGPVGATCCVIVPPNGNTVQLTLKGVTGDTGIPISAQYASVIPFFNTAVANSVGLASAAQITAGVVTLYFF